MLQNSGLVLEVSTLIHVKEKQSLGFSLNWRSETTRCCIICNHIIRTSSGYWKFVAQTQFNWLKWDSWLARGFTQACHDVDQMSFIWTFTRNDKNMYGGRFFFFFFFVDFFWCKFISLAQNKTGAYIHVDLDHTSCWWINVEHSHRRNLIIRGHQIIVRQNGKECKSYGNTEWLEWLYKGDF